MGTINVFLSHSWENDKEYQTINQWLRESSLINHKMYAVSKGEMEQHERGRISKKQLEEELEHRIKISSLFICFNDKTYSQYGFNWSKYELETAKKMQKSILVIYRWGMNQLPEPLKGCDKAVNWNSENVISAIKALTQSPLF